MILLKVKDFMNIIDLVAILPYYFVMTFNIRLGSNGPIPCVPEGEEDRQVHTLGTRH